MLEKYKGVIQKSQMRCKDLVLKYAKNKQEKGIKTEEKYTQEQRSYN